MDSVDRNKKKAWKDAEGLRARRAFPLPDADLADLFKTLDAELQVQECDDTRRITDAWAAKYSHSGETLGAWLADNGGYCDCEVLANVEPHWEEHRQPADA